MVQMNFNAGQYEPSTGAADVLETGVYSVQIVNSEVKQTKAGNGYMLVLTLSCLDPGFTGRRLTARLNIQNPNAQAMEIAMRELSAISHVVGILNWTDTQQLHGRPFKVSVEKKERDDKPGSFNNEIKAYMDYAGNAPSPAGAAGGQSAPPAAPPTAPPAAPVNTAPAPMQPPAQEQYAPAPVHAPVQDPAAAAGAAPWQQAAPAQAPAHAPQPQTTSAPAAQAPWQQGAPAPAPQPGAAAPWNQAPQNAGAPAVAPPWAQQ